MRITIETSPPDPKVAEMAKTHPWIYVISLFLVMASFSTIFVAMALANAFFVAHQFGALQWVGAGYCLLIWGIISLLALVKV